MIEQSRLATRASPVAEGRRLTNHRDRRLAPLTGIVSWPAVALIVVWASIAVVVWARLDEGWVPHDDGSFAQSAHRVLHGELPHRDFAELYTGGMTFLNAGVFALFGENLMWLRLPLFLVFLAALPCFYYLARRFLSPGGSVVATVAGAAWGLPVYPAAVPSWYVLYFSIGGAAALFRYLETGRRRWLFVAGLLGGLAISFKIVGLYFVLAVVLFLWFVDQRRHATVRRRFALADLLACAVVPFALAVVAGVIRNEYGAGEIVSLVVPVVAVCAIVLVGETSTAPASAFARLRRRLRLLSPLALGVAIPIAFVALPYVATGSADDLVHGVLVAPQSRSEFAYSEMISPIHLVWAVPVVLALVAPAVFARRWSIPLAVAGSAVMIVLIAIALADETAYDIVLTSGRALAPLVTTIGALAILAFARSAGRNALAVPLFLVVSMTAFLALVQYPFAAPVYFCYVAPLVVLATVGVATFFGVASRPALTLLLAAYAAFGIAMLDRGYLTLPPGDMPTSVLDPERAAIRVPSSTKAVYGRVGRLLSDHADGSYVFAGPDSPEVYFLAKRENPTRALFDFLDDTDSARGVKLLRSLEAHGVTAIVINHTPDFSPPLEPQTLRALRSTYSAGVRIGSFEVRWKPPSASTRS